MESESICVSHFASALTYFDVQMQPKAESNGLKPIPKNSPFPPRC